MSAAAIPSALLPKEQGTAAAVAATQSALTAPDSVFSAILKGVDSEDAGSQVTARGFGATETKSDSSLPQPQRSAVTTSASSPAATFEASLAALDYQAVAGTDSSTGIANRAEPSQSQTPTAATSDAQASETDQATSPRGWTLRTLSTQTNASPAPTGDANLTATMAPSTWTRAAAQIEIGQSVACAANAAGAATAAANAATSSRGWTLRTLSTQTNASPAPTGEANLTATTAPSTRTPGAAQVEIGQSVASATNAAGDTTAAANAATSSFNGGAVRGSVKTRSSETRNSASEIAAAGQDASNAASAAGAQLNASQTASIWAQLSAFAVSSASPSQGSSSDAANNQTEASRLELGQKFWTWPKSNASETPVAASNWDLSGATPLNSLLAGDSSLGFSGLQATTHLAVAGSLPVKIVSAESSGTSASTPSIRARPTNDAPAPAANAQPQSASASESSLQRQQSDADTSGSKHDDFAASAASVTSAIDANGGVATATTSAASLPVSGLADFIAGEAESMSTPQSANASSGVAAAAQQAPGGSKVKELVIALEPENLGKMSLRLRLTNGKLSVSIGVANQQTLAAIEDESSAIASRLAGGQQSLESLIIHPQEGSITDAGNSGTGDFSGHSAPAGRNSEGKDLSQGAARKPAYQPQNSGGAMAGVNADMLVV